MLEFDESTHTYRWNGVKVPSVTQICEIGSTYISKGFNDPVVLQAAADKGSAIHTACETLDKSGFVTVTEEYIQYMDAYYKFLEDYAIVWEVVEEMYYNPLDEYAGRIDRYGYSGKLENTVLVDIKTCGKIDRKKMEIYKAQLFAYSQFTDRFDNAALYVLHLKSDGTYELKDASGGAGAFIAMLELYKILNTKRRISK